MKSLTPLDISIIIGYVIIVTILGLWCRRKASKDITSYFLGGRNIPWWALSLSGSVSTFDITGTMWIVSLFFLIGVKSIWIHWMWGFLMAAFFMSYMGSWVRRSGVLTGAEWMEVRFGSHTGGKAARAASALLAVVTCVAFIAYATEGIGKFGSEYLPWNTTTCALVIVGATTIYTLLGGIYSVVLTDVIQAFLVLGASVIITVIAITHIDPAVLAEKVPSDWFDLTFSWSIPRLENHTYYFFGGLIIVYVAKGLLLNAGGPQQIYDFQRFLSAKNDRDAAKIGSIWSVFLCYRWSLAMGIAALAISMGMEVSADSNPERVLPVVLAKYLRPGLLGFVIAGLLAASMSTFSSTLNGGASYVVNDFYKSFLRPKASEKELVMASYTTSLLIVAAGVLLRFIFVSGDSDRGSIGAIFHWIMLVLGGGILIPNFLRWYWWRFNGWGYTWGVVTTVIASFFFLKQPDYIVFPLFFAIGLVSSIAASLLTTPTPMETLKLFYRKTRPAGFWKPVVKEIIKEAPAFTRGASFGRQVFNTAAAGIGIVALYLFPVYLVLKMWPEMSLALGVLSACCVILFFTWYIPLSKED